MADIFWHEILNHARFVELSDFVVMPNHIHGILILDKPEIVSPTAVPDTAVSVTPPTKNERMARISPKADSVFVMLRSYKAAITKHANRLGYQNGWQTRFHDHIIRGDAEYQRIADYIANNPRNWRDDRFYGPPS